MVYILFLDEMDIFSIVRNINKRNELKEQNIAMRKQLKETSYTVHKLYKPYFLESYARSHKFFKKDDEDIFVITYQKREHHGK